MQEETNLNPERNVYELSNFKPEDGKESVQPVAFYKLSEDGTYENGTTVEELLRLAAERLGDLHNRLPSSYNVEAIKKIQEALGHLHARTANRIARDVEGTHKE